MAKKNSRNGVLTWAVRAFGIGLVFVLWWWFLHQQHQASLEAVAAIHKVAPAYAAVPPRPENSARRKSAAAQAKKQPAPAPAKAPSKTEKVAATQDEESPKKETQKSAAVTAEIGKRKDSTGSIPVALRDMSVEEWMAIEAEHAPGARRKLEKGIEGNAKQGSGGVFSAIDVALPLAPPILQYALNTGSGQAQKNIVGLKRMSKLAKSGNRKCIVYGMGIAEESDFEQMMGRAGCETHGFDCTVDFEAPAVYKKPFNFHQWCIGDKPADSQKSGDNTYSSSATVRIKGKLPCDDCGDIEAKIVSGGKGGGGNRADLYMGGKRIDFNTGRGLNVVTIDPASRDVLSKETYDTYEKAQADGDRLAQDLEALPDGRIVMIALMDTGLENLNSKAKEALQSIGASKLDGGFRESYGFIGRKGRDAVGEARSRDMNNRLVFKTLAQTMEELGHTYLDLLKFDIEGFEWNLFASEILTKDREHLPEQISFELHTKAANPAYVPQDVVRGKGFKQVNKLILDLFNAGYRITSKEVNNGDPACAEFVALNVY